LVHDAKQADLMSHPIHDGRPRFNEIKGYDQIYSGLLNPRGSVMIYVTKEYETV
jgi:hypothetical protein